VDSHLRSDEPDVVLQQRRLRHDRVRVIGLLIIVVVILLFTFLHFGKTIPWAAR
jgi:hypothetical protein